MKTVPNGVWPTMITPFTTDNKVDYSALEELVEWFIEKGVDGLFAVCQSSEMFLLTLEERVNIAKFVKEKSNGRVPVIASGHISEAIEDQIIEINAIAETGVDAIVLVTGRIAKEYESDDIWKSNVNTLMNNIHEDIKLGFYECPAPYKRLISPELLKWCAETDRFLFLKDTSCDLDNMKAKLEAIKKTNLKIFNAHSVTLLDSLKEGIAGYSGVMANFHPDLYAWLCRNWENSPSKAKDMASFLGIASLLESGLYPINAKYTLGLEGIHINLNSRVKDPAQFTKILKYHNDHLYHLTSIAREFIKK